jgi:hypothetical protein
MSETSRDFDERGDAMADNHSPDYLRAIERIRARVPQLARAVVAEHRSAGSPPHNMTDVLSTTAPHTVRHFLRAFLDAASQGRTLDSEALALLAERARDRAVEGVRLDQIIAVHQSVATALLADFRRQFSGTAAEFGYFADLLQRASGQAAAMTIQAFQEETHALRNSAPDPREELARHLVDGETLDHGTIPLDVNLTAGFTVLALHLEHDQPEITAAPPGRRAVAHRRRLHRVRAAALDALPGQALPLLTGHRSLLVLTGFPDRAALLRLHAGLVQSAQAPVLIAQAVAAAVVEVPAAAAEAQDLLATARAFEHPGPVVSLDELALDHHLARDTTAAHTLRGQLAPALDDATLHETLAAYVRHDLDRRRTAAALGIHPNTVDNRLQRAGHLAGQDFTTTRSLLTLAVALATEQAAAGVAVCPAGPRRRAEGADQRGLRRQLPCLRGLEGSGAN